MADDVGPLRTGARLEHALATIDDLTRALGETPVGDGKAFDLQRLGWFDLRNMLLVARVVAETALGRTESRGAHRREDHPDARVEWEVNQIAGLAGEHIEVSKVRSAAEVTAS
jgi:succinate dehydrogenase / fumarate reductase flavoprotein subunit